jgi:hypothetical protein
MEQLIFNDAREPDQKLKAAYRKFPHWCEGHVADTANGIYARAFWTRAFWTQDAMVWIAEPGKRFDHDVNAPLLPLENAREMDRTARRVWGPDKIKALVKFAAPEPGRYRTDCTLIEWYANTTRFTCTDGRHLASIHGGDIIDESKTEPLAKFAVDSKALALIYDVFAKMDGAQDVTFNVLSRNGVNKLFILSRRGLAILDGNTNYPEYRWVLPETKHTVEVHPKFWDTVEVLKGVTSEDSADIRVDFLANGKQTEMHLRAHHKPTGARAAAVMPTMGRQAKENFKEVALHICPRQVGNAIGLIRAFAEPWNAANPIELKYIDNDHGFYFHQRHRKQDIILCMPIPS